MSTPPLAVGSRRRDREAGSEEPSVTDLIADLPWYTSISIDRGLAPRCPYATVERCPRYYQSLSLLGRAGSTGIDKAEDERLLHFWQGSDLWPKTREQETSIWHTDDDARGFINFCPEVSFDRFGYFASYLHRYADELDVDAAHLRLSESAAPRNHWGWAWSTVTATHYTECSVYSVLVGDGDSKLAPASARPETTRARLWSQYGPKIVTGVIVAVVAAGILALLGVVF